LLGAFYSEARAAFQRAAVVACALGCGPEYDSFHARHDRWLDDAERQLFTLSLMRVLSPRP
jgi:hypothetical protein